MLRKIKLIITLCILSQNFTFAQKDTLAEPIASEKLKVEFYFRGGFLSDYNREELSSSRFQIDNARLNIQGDYNKSLGYRVRFRYNKPFTTTSLDNGSFSLDYAYITYRFGTHRTWEATLGKQLSVMGSFERDINPLYEYIFTDYLNGVYANIFLAGAQLSYKFSPRHTFGVQLHNTLNQTFEKHLESNNFTTNYFTASQLPIGGYLYWNGTFFEGKFKTKYSYNLAQFAQDYYTHSISLGNKLQIGRHTAYLDLVYSHMGADFGLTSSKLLNIYDGQREGTFTMRKNIVYKCAVSRYDYQIDDQWSLTGKLGIETTGSKNVLSEQLRTNYIYFLAAQYAPLKTQDLRFYVAYVGNSIIYDEALRKQDEQLHRIAVGAYYTLPVWKK